MFEKALKILIIEVLAIKQNQIFFNRILFFVSSVIDPRICRYRSLSDRFDPKWHMQSPLSSIKYVKIVWSIVQSRFFWIQSSYQILEAQILNRSMQWRRAGSLFDAPVTPTIEESKKDRNFQIFSSESLSGSTETKIILRGRFAPSRFDLRFWQALESLRRLLGQISGQLQKPKQIRQQEPSRSFDPNQLPLVSMSFHSPPISAFPVWNFFQLFLGLPLNSCRFMNMQPMTRPTDITPKMQNELLVYLAYQSFNFCSV